ncbi:hypothetical protein BDV96DRAFT_604024 [Lophiotrema nucula]|uniref:Uncharacterized protein n=1 Tax=Lophiotrema nucula TaxID=690887 RepID=A0A6A5YTV2_9PLEO|nr:hypothetical protein BDV96DRAFT_604024 [Lophiotrema nucula]
MIKSWLLILVLPLLGLCAPAADVAPAPAATLNPKWKFQKLLPSTPDKVLFQNSCDYAVYVQAVSGDPTKTPPPPQEIGGASKWTGDLSPECVGQEKPCGTSLKISRAIDMQVVVQFEFTVNVTTGDAWYDISLINCIKDMNVPNKDATACPGWEAGILATAAEGSSVTCNRMECAPRFQCEENAYFFELDKVAGAHHPVAPCPANRGIAIEICAA